MPTVRESGVVIRTNGLALMISRSPRRTVTGARKLWRAEATIGLRTSRSPLCATLALPSFGRRRGAMLG